MKLTILGLDFGTQLGWALRHSNGTYESGVLSTKPVSARQPGSRFRALRALLIRLHKEHDLGLVVYENITFAGAGDASGILKMFGGYEAVVQMYCEREGVMFLPLAPTTLKKYVTGDGRASKALMVEWVSQVHPCSNHNEADALGLVLYGEGFLRRVDTEMLVELSGVLVTETDLLISLNV